MLRAASLALLGTAVLGCRGDSPHHRTRPPDAPTDAAPAIDAGLAAPPPSDPDHGEAADDAADTQPSGRPVPRERRVAQILLRSTPPHAFAEVDGVALGPTPVLWEGELTGQPHEFKFFLPGYELVHYTFVPITGGIVHATLTRIGRGEPR